MTGKLMADEFDRRIVELSRDHHHADDGDCNCNELIAELAIQPYVRRALIGIRKFSGGPELALAMEMSVAFEAGYEYALRQLGGRRAG